MLHRSLLLTASWIFTTSLAIAGKNADLKSSTPHEEKPVLASAFEVGTLEEPWKVMKGDWQIKDGAIIGKELAADKHTGVLSLNIPKKDSVIRFSFKLDGAKSFHLSFNHPKGHLFRIQISEDMISMNLDKDKKDETSKATPLGKASGKFGNGEWHTMMVEINGEKVSVQTDSGAKIEATNPALAKEKTGYRFIVKGESILIDDMKIWDIARKS